MNTSCCSICQSTNLKANHNKTHEMYETDYVVVQYAKVQI